ncbi:MAG: response regulator [Candidatus Thiodiazotropha sp. (ex Dulcina madagascariensis)]|nr:response regulator [Candidatus Thiodiazotropha sp. (ex Dulcina madagascariensis)]MCU7927376.1 response regulator [Candidatus Thiodiazotropha sp. (ex Dulcina madagascariensis)]
MIDRISLRWLIPLALLLFTVSLILSLSFWHYHVERKALQAHYQQRAEIAIDSLHRLISLGLAHGQTEMTRQAMAGVEAFPCFYRAFALDEGGRVFLASREAWVGNRLTEIDPLQAAQWPTGKQRLVRLEKEGTRVAAYQPIPITAEMRANGSANSGWLFLELDLHEALEKHYQAAITQTSAAVTLVLIFSLMLWFWIDRSVTRPLLRLSAAARRVAAGNTGQRLKARGGRELAELAHSFNFMGQELSRRHAALVRQRILYQALSDTNQSIVRVADEAMLLSNVCEVAVNAGIKLVWIGFVDRGTNALKIAHIAGDEAGWLETVRKHIGLENDPLASAVKSGEESIVNFADHGLRDNHWFSEAQLNGFSAGAAFPVRRGGAHIGGLVVMSDDAGLVEEDSLRLLREMASDLSFALDGLDREIMRRRVEQSLVSDRALLRTLIDTIPDLIFFKDKAQIYLGCNKAFESLVAIPESKMVGSSDQDILPVAQAQMFHEQDKQILSSGMPMRSEAWMEYPDGRKVLLDIVKTPYRGPDDKVMGLIGVGRDITAEHRARKELQETLLILENAERISNLGSWAYDPETDRMRWSEVIYQILGVDETVTEPDFGLLLERCHPDDRSRMLQNKEAVKSGQLAEFVHQHRIITPDGEIRHVIDCGRIHAQRGQPFKVIGTIQDITRRKQAEQERERALEAMRQAQKLEAIGELTGGVVHDLNNILAPILGFADLARRSDALSQEKLQTYLRGISDAATRGRDLVARLIAVSRGDSNREATPQDMSQLVAEMLKLLRATLPVGIRIETHCEATLPKVLIDPVHLNQILMNLCINAKDALGDKGEITVELSFRQGLDLACNACGATVIGDRVELCVTDNGPGIAKDDLSKLFDPLFTTKPSGERPGGMGLAAVQRLLRGYQAHVKVETGTDAGTRFRLFFLPYSDDGESQSIAHTDADAHGPRFPPRRRVLLVDDESAIVLFLKDFLEMQGLSVEAFTDSAKALRRFSQSPEAFDLLITDQAMPGLTGLELIEQVRSAREDLPVVLCTGYSERVNEENASAQGVDHYLEKPLMPADLIDVLVSSLGRI